MGHNVEYGHKFLPNGENAVEDIFIFLYHRFGHRWKGLCMSSEGHVFGVEVVDNLPDAVERFGGLRYKDNAVLHDTISKMYPSGYRVCIVPYLTSVSFAPLQEALQRKAALGLAQVAKLPEPAPQTAPALPLPIFTDKALALFVFDYENYRGEVGRRTVIPKGMSFGSTEYHTEPQWLLDAWDVDKQADRTFAFSGIYPKGTFKWLDFQPPTVER